MKKLWPVACGIALILGTAHPALSQGPTFHSGYAIGAANDQICQGVFTDNAKNRITMGEFKGTVDFDPGPAVASLNAGLYQHGFVTKSDSNGNFLWAVAYGSSTPTMQLATSGVADTWGNLYFVGNFVGTFDFDPGPGTFNLTSAGDKDVFILKLTSNGNFVWAKQIGGTSEDKGYATADQNGNLYLTGSFEGSVDFDPGSGTDNRSAAGFKDVFVMKLDSAGNLVWAKTVGASNWDVGTDITLDSASNLLIAGSYLGFVDFDPGPGIDTVDSGNWEAGFVIKWDTNGNHVWAGVIKGVGNVLCEGLATDQQDNVYIAGEFQSTPDCDPGPGVFNLTGSYDIFATKWNAQGDFVWAKGFGGSNIDGFISLAANSTGHLFLGGSFRLATDFDPGPATLTLTAGSDDVGFIAKWDTAGNLIWANDLPVGISQVRSVAVDADKKLYAVGVFTQSVDLDPDAVGTYTLTTQGFADGFSLCWDQDTCPSFALVIDSLKDVECFSLGYAEGHIANGPGPYMYQWNTNPLTLDSIALFDTAGIYTLTAIGPVGCSRTATVIVNSPPAFNGLDLNAHWIQGPNPYRPGFPVSAILDIVNEGCVPVSGDAMVVLDTFVNFVNAVPPPDLILGDTLIWHHPTINWDSAHFIVALDMLTSVQATIGTRVYFDLILNPTLGDVDLDNNIKHYDFPVIGSFDPNDKHVHPTGACDAGYILHDQVLTYTIRFQNTGNADAINVEILDTLSPFLDLSTVRVMATSHRPLIPEVLPGNAMRFRYPEIHLPDSTTDEPNSHGYIVYEVMPHPQAPLQSVVENTAAIYFDFNAPVITNTVANTLTDTLPQLSTQVTVNGNTLVATPGAGSYQWLDCNNGLAPVAGATSATFTPLTSGSYAVILQSGTCTETSPCYPILLVSTPDSPARTGIRCSPNPTTDGWVRIAFDVPVEFGLVRVADMMGRTVSVQTIENCSLHALQLPAAAGMYFITVGTPTGNFPTLKMIRE